MRQHTGVPTGKHGVVHAAPASTHEDHMIGRTRAQVLTTTKTQPSKTAPKQAGKCAACTMAILAVLQATLGLLPQ